MLLVTLDTNASDAVIRQRMMDACLGLGVEANFAHTTVTDRETEDTSFATANAAILETGLWDESRWDKAVWAGDTVRESFVIGESRLGEGVLGSDDASDFLERILDTIGNGSFPRPGQRENLTDSQRRQRRDAMVLEAHHREGRDVLITLDVKGFIRRGRREALERLCCTRIATVDEFCENPSARWG